MTTFSWGTLEITKNLTKTCLSYVFSLDPASEFISFRVYFIIKEEKVIFLLCGGDKATQSKDIKKARAIIDELE